MISIKKRTTNIQVQNKVYRKCIKEVKKQSSVSDDECSEELIEIPIKRGRNRESGQLMTLKSMS
jgi:hypothetical protein